jgi:hypothetical protein
MRALALEIPPFRRFLVAVLLAHLVAIMAMAASPALHELVHAGAHDDHEHECAVTLYTTGGVDGPMIVVFVVAAVVRAAALVAPRVERVAGIFRVLRIWEHAPPVAA